MSSFPSSPEQRLRAAIDLSPFDKCDVLAERIAWLQNMVGFPVTVRRARDGWVLIASQFVIAAGGRCFAALKISDAELEQ